MTHNSGKHKGQTVGLAQPRAARDIIIVGAPVILLGIMGTVVGGSRLLGGAIINLGYLAMIFAGARLLKKQGSSWKEIGLKAPAQRFKTVLLGVAAFVGALILFVAAQGAAAAALDALGMAGQQLDQSRFNPLQDNLPLFILLLVLAWTTIAFGEELFYRAFLITRLVDHGGMRRAVAIAISGIVFGLVHFAEGQVGIFANAAFGFLFGWIFVKSGRNLWITIIAHGILNTLRFSLLYAGAV